MDGRVGEIEMKILLLLDKMDTCNRPEDVSPGEDYKIRLAQLSREYKQLTGRYYQRWREIDKD